MVSAPSAVQNIHFTSAGATSLTATWSPPANNGGAAIVSYAVSLFAYDPTAFTQYPVGQYGSGTTSGVTGTSFTASGLQPPFVYQIGVQAYNGQFYSDSAFAAYAGIPKTASTINKSFTETMAVSEGGSPIVTLPSAFGVVTRLNKAIDYVYGQLALQLGRADPDAGSADPAAVMASLQPINRLALGGSDVVAAATDSEKLAGEIPNGTLSSAKATLAHTSGATSFTLTKTWTADRTATIYTMAVLNNMPIGYASDGPFYQDLGIVRRTLVWTYDIPTPIGVATGDQFTSTVTIVF